MENDLEFHSTDPVEVARTAERMIEMNGSYRAYIRSVVSGLENPPMDVILKEIETYEELGTFRAVKLEETSKAASEAGNARGYVGLDGGRDEEEQY